MEHQTAPKMYSVLIRACSRSTLILLWWIALNSGASAVQNNIFAALTGHIREQIQLDKQGFLTAQTCTEWFYRKPTPRSSKPKVEGVSFSGLPDCSNRYPGGLSAAREDFSRAQSQLSASLTFYECALVADRNDDHLYSERELQDMLGAFGLPYRETSPGANLEALRNTFERIHDAASLDLLTSGIAKLYEKGYRLSAGDRLALDKIIG